MCRLPYTEATVLEIQRFITVAPLTVPHVAEKDTTVGEYYIPKVFFNYYWLTVLLF